MGQPIQPNRLNPSSYSLQYWILWRWMNSQTSSSVQFTMGFNTCLDFITQFSITLRASSLSLLSITWFFVMEFISIFALLFFLITDSAHLTPVTQNRPSPPRSLSSRQQNRIVLVGG